jgi:hypothetical protein
MVPHCPTPPPPPPPPLFSLLPRGGARAPRTIDTTKKPRPLAMMTGGCSQPGM